MEENQLTIIVFHVVILFYYSILLHSNLLHYRKTLQ